MIAVTFALPQESGAFRSLLSDVKVEAISGVITGSLAGRQIVLCHTGVGPAAAVGTVRRFLAEHRPEQLICAGFAGALERDLEVGDLVVATNYSTPDLLDKCRANLSNGQRRHFGILTSQGHVVETAAAKERLLIRTGAMAVDMETDVVADECRHAAVPLLAMRVISDRAEGGLPVPVRKCFDLDRQRPRPIALIGYLIGHGRSIVPFARFVCALPRIRGVLARAVTDAIECVS